MIEVWHARNPTFGFGEGNSNYPNDFQLVAVVNTGELDEVFRLTNTVEKPWWFNEGVIAKGDGFRSTSVGDVLVTEDRKIHIVGPSGYIHLEDANPQLIPQKLH